MKVLKHVLRTISANFLLGLVAILPLVVTVAILVWVEGFIRGFIGPETFVGRQLQRIGLPLSSDLTAAYLIGCAIVLVAIFFLGILMRAGGKRLLQDSITPLIRRVPIIGNVYGTTAQIVGMLEGGDQADLKKMQVVFVSFGAMHGCGLLALMPSSESVEFNGIHYNLVYIPTSPVPMTGGLLFVPADFVQTLPISVDALMSIYLSMGVTTSQYLSTSSDRHP